MSLILDGTNGLSDVDGSAATPAIRGTDANTGIFFGADIIGFSEGGTEVARFNADSQFVAAAGTASLPVVTTTGDTNTGIFFPAADTIAFAEGGVEAMRIDSSGNLGIGTTSPASTLDVVASGVATATIRTTSTTGSREAKLRLNVPSTGGDDPAGQVEFTYGTGYTVAGSIQMTHTNPNMKFFTGTTERARIDGNGNLLVGVTSQIGSGKISVPYSSSAYGIAMKSTTADSANYAIEFKNSSNSGVGAIYASTTTTTYATSSDYRLKENIAPMTGALSIVAQLKPCTYKWKSNGSDGQGFIAHELQSVVPDAVVGEKDAVDEEGNPKYQGIDTSFLVATLTAAIKEQQAIIELLKARLDAANL